MRNILGYKLIKIMEKIKTDPDKNWILQDFIEIFATKKSIKNYLTILVRLELLEITSRIYYTRRKYKTSR